MRYKKMFTVFFAAAAFLTACSSEGSTSSNNDEEPVVEQEKNNEPTQEELNDKLKSEAVEASFVELNDPAAEINKQVFAVGEVSVKHEDGIFQVFDLSVKEGEGYGIYQVTDVLKVTDYSDGDTVKVYGIYKGKDEATGMPMINSTVIEKQ
jgi:hypothetical protein